MYLAQTTLGFGEVDVAYPQRNSALQRKLKNWLQRLVFLTRVSFELVSPFAGQHRDRQVFKTVIRLKRGEVQSGTRGCPVRGWIYRP